MDNLITFLTIIAWPVAILYTIISLFIVLRAWTYDGSKEQLLDNIKGKNKRFNILKPILIALVAWAFIIAF